MASAVRRTIPPAADADDGKPVDRFRRVDRVPARNRNAGRGAHRRAAGKDRPDDVERHFIEGDAENRERHDRLAAHRVDVGDRIGGGDASKIMRVVDDRHEEVGGRNDAGLVVELPDRRIVAGLHPDDQPRVGGRLCLPTEKLLQDRRRQFGAAPAAMSKAGQFGFRDIHDCLPVSCSLAWAAMRPSGGAALRRWRCFNIRNT